MKALRVLLILVFAASLSKAFAGLPPPIEMDRDRDGLCDECEQRIFHTDPTTQDSEDDTIPDGFEDHDDNGLTNLEEQGKIKAFIEAVEHDNRKSILSLLAYARYMPIVGPWGETALMVAARKGNEKTVRLLLSLGADVNEQGIRRPGGQCCQGWSGDSALLYGSKNAHARIVRILLDAGADLNAKNDHGMTALMCAATSDDFYEIRRVHSEPEAPVETVKVLLDAGADVTVKNDAGETALMMARGRRTNELVQLFRRAAANAGTGR